ncbi:hypothetical protein HHL08_17735 [Sphingobium sp. AR-3-1]|uniref:Uncharacterized protein n=1 Tax=Sphingobium psychrophilum TaxID=2728834 RepID=A0A7X9ZUU4_9SPHN|nr:hypothetical protein [Sphingobium psychrophilum]NML11966.1 hypothetical protein [Sphingobium psychrophilum]
MAKRTNCRQRKLLSPPPYRSACRYRMPKRYWCVLVRAGARCQLQRRNPEVIECVYSQRTTIDDYYAADIVWTTALHGEGARVAQISIRRELDKH